MMTLSKLLSGLALLLVGLSRLAAAAPEPPAEKPFVLFMGADIDVEQGGENHRVKNVAGDAFVIAVDDQTVEVPMNRGRLNLNVTPLLKLSDRTAVVQELKIERAYTPANHPHAKWAGAGGSAAQALVGIRAGQMANAIMGAQLASQRGAALGGPSGPLQGGGAGQQIEAYHDATREAASDLNNAGHASARLQEELDQQLFDAAVLTCEVSASSPFPEPYLVVVAYYREKGESRGLRSRIFARALDRLDERPVKVRVIQGDFPPGYELVRTRVHLYDGAREIGTNVADKNVWLTREEAHEYVVLDHITSHKGATLPPGLAFGVHDWELRPHYSAEEVQQVVYLKVTKAGLPLGAYRDEECHRRSGDAYLEQLLARIRFKPALQAGKAVDGVAKLRIADLVTP
jgi:hypothetical protein